MTIWALMVSVTTNLFLVAVWAWDRHQGEVDRRAERSQMVAALLSQRASEFVEAQRRVDPAITAPGAKEFLARRRRRQNEEADASDNIPIGL